jgi:drug/metabolite transporter (DMT)-like permease
VLLSTVLAYLLYFSVLRSAGATNLLLVTLLMPVSAHILGAVFLDEPLYSTSVAGMLFIVLGLSIIDGRLVRRLRGTKSNAPARLAARDVEEV